MKGFLKNMFDFNWLHRIHCTEELFNLFPRSSDASPFQIFSRSCCPGGYVKYIPQNPPRETFHLALYLIAAFFFFLSWSLYITFLGHADCFCRANSRRLLLIASHCRKYCSKKHLTCCFSGHKRTRARPFYLTSLPTRNNHNNNNNNNNLWMSHVCLGSGRQH